MVPPDEPGGRYPTLPLLPLDVLPPRDEEPDDDPPRDPPELLDPLLTLPPPRPPPPPPPPPPLLGSQLMSGRLKPSVKRGPLSFLMMGIPVNEVRLRCEWSWLAPSLWKGQVALFQQPLNLVERGTGSKRVRPSSAGLHATDPDAPLHLRASDVTSAFPSSIRPRWAVLIVRNDTLISFASYSLPRQSSEDGEDDHQRRTSLRLCGI